MLSGQLFVSMYAIRICFSMYYSNSTMTMLNSDISCFEISVDPEQLASEKDPHYSTVNNLEKRILQK